MNKQNTEFSEQKKRILKVTQVKDQDSYKGIHIRITDEVIVERET